MVARLTHNLHILHGWYGVISLITLCDIELLRIYTIYNSHKFGLVLALFVCLLTKLQRKELHSSTTFVGARGGVNVPS